jgi:predicted RecA/RadA family phage recombinase
LPEEYRDMPGRVTADVTIPRLKEFLEEGGTVVTIGSSTALAGHLGLPVGDHLATRDPDGKEKPLGREKFYVPGSLVRARVDPATPLAWGLDEQVDVMFLSSPVFRLPAGEGTEAKGVKRVAWYDGKTTLRSGWAWGQEHLDGGVAVAEAEVGKGRLVLCGPQIAFRGQPHGTLKFLFNALTGTGRAE